MATLREQAEELQKQRNKSQPTWGGVPQQLPEQPKQGGYWDNLSESGVKPAVQAPEPPQQEPAENASYMDILRRYMPKPDYEQEKKNARRAQMGAFISDLANVVGKAGASAGGAWMISPTQFKTPAASQQYNNVIQQERAAYMDYGGRLASAAIKDMEAKKAAQALAAQNQWEQTKFGLQYQQQKDKLDYQQQKDQRDYELAVLKANRDYELGKISASQRDRQIKEAARHNRVSEANAREANRIRSEKEGTSKGTTIYLQDKQGKKKAVSLSKANADNVMGYLARRIRQNLGDNKEFAADYDAIMSQYSTADSNTKLQAVVNLLGSEFPGLYEEAVQLIGSGGDLDTPPDEDVDVNQWKRNKQQKTKKPLD